MEDVKIMKLAVKGRPPSRTSAAPAGAFALLGVAVSPNGERMLIHFSALEGVLSRMHNTVGSRNAMASRLKYLRKLDFPFPPERRGKQEFGLDDALKVTLAFELFACGWTPIRAARLVRTDWPAMREAIARSWWARGRDKGGPIVLAVAPDAFAEFASPEILSMSPLSETLGWFAPAAVIELLQAPGAPTALILVDCGRMAERFAAAVADSKFASAADVRRGMLAFCAEAFGTDRQERWPKLDDDEHGGA